MRLDNLAKTAALLRAAPLLCLLCTVAVLTACGSSGDQLAGPDTDRGDGAVAMKLTIPQELRQSVARVEYEVSAPDMDTTLRGALEIIGNVASGTVGGIEPGADRLFVLNAYDTTGELSHTGSATASIEAGRTADVRIQLLPVSGAADVTGDFGDTPLFPEALELIGTWRLDVGATDDVEFTYTFVADGRFTNRIGGAFLSALRELDELQSIELVQLDQLDGATLVFSGIWTPGEDGALGLDFDRVEIELFGSVPLLGRIDVVLPGDDLGDGAEFELALTYSVDDDELRLSGPALTLGVPLAAEDAAGTAVDEFTELSGTSEAALRQIASVVGGAISDRDLDEVVLIRVE